MSPKPYWTTGKPKLIILYTGMLSKR